MVERRPPEFQLRLEVVVDLGLVHTGTLGDGARGCALEPMSGELVNGSLDERSPRHGGEFLAGHLAILYHLI